MNSFTKIILSSYAYALVIVSICSMPNHESISTDKQEADICEQASELAVDLYHERMRGVSRSNVMQHAGTAMTSSIVDAVYDAPETGADIRTIGRDKCVKMIALTKQMSR